ncbi:hypothetical protein [Helicobacter sp. T3_23-1056]
MVFYGIKIDKALAFVSVALACVFANHITLAHDTLAKNMTTTNNATPANNERERESNSRTKSF